MYGYSRRSLQVGRVFKSYPLSLPPHLQAIQVSQVGHVVLEILLVLVDRVLQGAKMDNSCCCS